MPLVSADLENDLKSPISTGLKAALSGAFELVPDGGNDELTKFCDSVGDALAAAIAPVIVNHLKTKAQVQGTVSSGAGAGGSIQGTLT